jgi:hypothetical protein
MPKVRNSPCPPRPCGGNTGGISLRGDTVVIKESDFGYILVTSHEEHET